MHNASDEEIAKLIPVVDYSEALTIMASEQEVRSACQVAKRYGFRAVVAFPQYLGILVDELKGSGVRSQIPVGFPCGGSTTHVKCLEAEEGLKHGANDVDMVMNISAFKSGNYNRVSDDIAQVLAVVKSFGCPFKVIIEIGVLTDEEKVTASKLVRDVGADFVKTCTGFGPGRVTIHDICMIKKVVLDSIGIKASGAVASLEDAVALMRAGATVVALRQCIADQLSEIEWRHSGVPVKS